MAPVRRSIHPFSVEKACNLLSSAQEALRDAQAPAKYISAKRRFEAAYDVGLSCALALLEASHFEVHGMGHHRDALAFLIKVLKLKGETAAAVKVLIRTRNTNKYDGSSLTNEITVTSAIKWADSVLVETKQWFAINSPAVLKRLDPGE
jgi:hypothetical protein